MSELEQQLLHIRLCRETDMPMLKAWADQDGHAVIAPSYIVEKSEQIVGYVGIIPCVLVWLDSQRVKARDSMSVLNFYENTLASQQQAVIALPCVEKSPLRPFLDRLGYVDTGETKLFLKNLKV